MRKNIHKNFIRSLSSKAFYLIIGGVLLVSCGAQMGGYTETDGVYYDPEKDVLPEQVVIQDETENQVGEEYDYEKSTNIIKNSNDNIKEQEKRYSNWNSNSDNSEWGDFNGTETYYDDLWAMNYGWGINNPYWGSNFGYSFGWGSPWSWNAFAYRPFWNYSYFGGMGWSSFGFDPFWGYYNPYAYGYYNPYYYGGGFYNGYYGYGNGYYSPAYRYNYRRSGANGRNYGALNKKGYSNTTSNSRFRNRTSGFRNTNKTYRNNNSYRRPTNSSQQSSGYRTAPRKTYNNSSSSNRTYRSTPSRSYNRSGSSSSRSSSRTSSGSSRSGRSGGFRR